MFRKPLVPKGIGMASVDRVFPPVKAFALMQIQDGQVWRMGGAVDFVHIVLQNMAVEISFRRVMFG